MASEREHFYFPPQYDQEAMNRAKDLCTKTRDSLLQPREELVVFMRHEKGESKSLRSVVNDMLPHYFGALRSQVFNSMEDPSDITSINCVIEGGLMVMTVGKLREDLPRTYSMLAISRLLTEETYPNPEHNGHSNGNGNGKYHDTIRNTQLLTVFKELTSEIPDETLFQFYNSLSANLRNDPNILREMGVHHVGLALSGVEETVKLYKGLYLIGAEANLGPMPHESHH